MANIKHYTNCGVCYANIAVSQSKVIGATFYCPTHYSQLITVGFDKTLGNPIEALSRLTIVSGR